MNLRLRRFLSYWLPVIVWLALIAVESTDMMSARNTGHWLAAVVTSFAGLLHLSASAGLAYVDWANHVLRKSGHFLGYGMLCLLFFRAFRATFSALLLRCALLAIAGTAMVASMDEWHQTFIPSRTGQVRDVLLDTCGAVLFQLVVLAFLRLRRKRSAPAG